MIDNQYIKESNCPYCGKFIDRAINPKDFKDIPTPGCLSICFGCTEISEFDENMELIKIDIATLDLETIRLLDKMQIALIKGKKLQDKL